MYPTCATEVERERDTPEIRIVISNLDDSICKYDNLLSRLSDRLSCVLRQSNPNDAKNVTKTFNTSLANDLNSLNIRLTNLTDDLESILYRLEI